MRLVLIGASVVGLMAFPMSAQGVPGLADCDPYQMMAALAEDFREYHEDYPIELVGLLGATDGPRNPFAKSEFQSTLLVQQRSNGALMPLQGKFWISGLVNDGGAGCTDPVGDNLMLESMIGTVTQEYLQKVVTERLQRMTAQEQMEMAQAFQNGSNAMDPVRARTMSQTVGFVPPMFPPSVMKDLQGSAMFLVYSPNAMDWLAGGLAKATEDRPIYEHEGIGGWAQNAAAEAWIVVPDSPVSALIVGEEHRILMPNAGVGSPIYVRTLDADWRRRDPRLYDCLFRSEAGGYKSTGPAQDDAQSKFRDTFQGEIWRLELRGEAPQGRLTVTAIADGTISATFELNGTAALIRERYEFRYSDNDKDQCEYGRPDALVRSERVATTTAEGPINLKGELTASSSLEVNRPGHRIAWTRIAGGVDAAQAPAVDTPSQGAVTPPANSQSVVSTPLAAPPSNAPSTMGAPPAAGSPPPAGTGGNGAPPPVATPPATGVLSGLAGLPPGAAAAIASTSGGGGGRCQYSVSLDGKQRTGNPGDRIVFVATPEGDQLMISTIAGEMFALELASAPAAESTGSTAVRSGAGNLGVTSGLSYETTGTGNLRFSENTGDGIRAVASLRVQVLDQRGGTKGQSILEFEVVASGQGSPIPGMPAGMGVPGVMCVVEK